MEPKNRERLLERVKERKRSYDSGIPSLPNPPSYYMPETNHINDDDEILELMKTLPTNFKAIWRKGSIELPALESPILLYRMPQQHQKTLLRNGGDATGCGKVWAAGLLFPVFSIAHDYPINRILKEWVRSSFVVEVGAGWSGTAGITAYRMGAAEVALTDGEEVMVECLSVNAAAAVGIDMEGTKVSTSPRPNSVYPIFEHDDYEHGGRGYDSSVPIRFQCDDAQGEGAPVELNSPLTAHRLRWGYSRDAYDLFQTTSHTVAKCDLVIGCDCIHDANCVEELLVMIVQHLKCDRVVLCWESSWQRMDGEELFMKRMLDFGFRLRFFSSSVLADMAQLHDSDIEKICEEIRSVHLESAESELNVLAAERCSVTSPHKSSAQYSAKK
jgi:predicted nicotinamide N-methyase